MKSLYCLAALALAAACGKRQESAPAPAPAPVVDAREVVVADVYGEPGSNAVAVAYWSHPSVNFASLIIVGGADGLRAYGVEEGEEVARVATLSAQKIAVGYRGEGETAQGIVAVETAEAFSFYSIDNSSRAFQPLQAMLANRPANGFCFDGATLYRTMNDRLAATNLSIDGGAVVVTGERATSVDGGLVACAIDPVSGNVVAIANTGALYRINAEGAATKLAEISLAGADGLAVIAREGASRIVALNGETGVVHLFDASDGHAEGAVRLAASFDHPGADKAAAIAASFGNLGGIYRDGALALVATGDDGAPVRAVSWTSVLKTLELADQPPIDPRAPLRVRAPESDALVEPASIAIEAP
jgi:hypothetical protein